MTRKDYIAIAIASVLRERHYCLREDITLGEVERKYRLQELELVADNLAYVFLNDNARFNSDHFLAVMHGEKELNSHPPRN
jgi:hypothetical protein